jgi:hypothetical protein
MNEKRGNQYVLVTSTTIWIPVPCAVSSRFKIISIIFLWANKQILGNHLNNLPSIQNAHNGNHP